MTDLKSDASDMKSVSPPDEEELLLSKLVFGETSEEFSKNLLDTINLFEEFDNEDSWGESAADALLNKSDALGAGNDENDEEQEEDEADLVNNDQLFYIDEDGDDEEDKMDIDDDGAMESEYSSDESDASDAWEDSDDENVDVNLWENNRTKKLKTSYVEKTINGSDYVQRLRTQFEKIYPKPKWTESIDESADEDEDDDQEEGQGADGSTTQGDVSALLKILQTTVDVKSTKKTKLLPQQKLDVIRVKDGNQAHHSHAAIQSISFHPSGLPVLLTGGYDRSLRLYHVDGKSNPLITSLYLQGTPIQTAVIYVNPLDTEQVTKVFSGGRRRYMHSWTLTASSNTGNLNINKISRMYGHEQTQKSFENFKMGHIFATSSSKQKTKIQSHGIICLQGNNGWVNILHASTNQFFTGVKINGTIADFAIDYQKINGTVHTVIIAVNTFGEVWEFDITDGNKVISNWKDESNFGITKVQVGGGSMSSSYLVPKSLDTIKQNRWLAIGSESGIVTIYDRYNTSGPGLVGMKAKPITVDVLTTSVSTIEFSHDGQLLCIASRSTKDALRLVHLPSGTVFSNWPNSGTPLGKVTSVKFSSNSEYLATGNLQGKVRLWRLSHYY
ncbi:hypothetical protein ACO0QE_004048 [Hanseniaspora vineae]